MGSGASGLLNDLAANDKTVHSDFYNQENIVTLMLVKPEFFFNFSRYYLSHLSFFKAILLSFSRDESYNFRNFGLRQIFFCENI